MKTKIKNFSLGVLQVALVSSQTYIISKTRYDLIALFGFMISLVWSFNVKSVAFGSNWDRVAYALGASTGSVLGVMLAQMFYLS